MKISQSHLPHRGCFPCQRLKTVALIALPVLIAGGVVIGAHFHLPLLMRLQQHSWAKYGEIGVGSVGVLGRTAAAFWPRTAWQKESEEEHVAAADALNIQAHAFHKRDFIPAYGIRDLPPLSVNPHQPNGVTRPLAESDTHKAFEHYLNKKTLPFVSTMTLVDNHAEMSRSATSPAEIRRYEHTLGTFYLFAPNGIEQESALDHFVEYLTANYTAAIEQAEKGWFGRNKISQDERAKVLTGAIEKARFAVQEEDFLLTLEQGEEMWVVQNGQALAALPLSNQKVEGVIHTSSQKVMGASASLIPYTGEQTFLFCDMPAAYIHATLMAQDPERLAYNHKKQPVGAFSCARIGTK